MLASKNRFHRRNHVMAVLRKGGSVRGTTFSLKYMPSSAPDYQFAIIVSKKVAKRAHERNRIRRRLYAALRTIEPDIPAGMRGVLVVYDGSVKSQPYHALAQEVRRLITKASARQK